MWLAGLLLSVTSYAAEGPVLTLSSPKSGEGIAASAFTVQYAASGDLTGVTHVHLRLDTQPEVEDLDFDGRYPFSNVPVGSHTLEVTLARADHTRLGNPTATVLVTFSVTGGSTSRWAASPTVEAGPIAYSVTASPTTVLVGASVAVSWVTPAGQATRLDWIGLYVVGQRNSLYVAAQRTGGTETGTLTFPMPATPGAYEFRFLPNGGYTDVARSAVVTVQGASFTLSFSATPAVIQAGEASELVWTTTAGAVGCAAGWDAASPARPVTGRESVRPSGTTTYVLTCRDAAGLTVTQSVRVAVGAERYGVTATPSRVSPGAGITVTWVTPAGQATPLDWIGLYVVGRRNSLYDAAQRTGGTEAGTLTFTAPATLGSYEFRFLPNGGYIDVARSGTVTVGNFAAITSFGASPAAVAGGGTTRLTWESRRTTGCEASGGWSGPREVSGFRDVTVDVTTTFILTCTGDGESDTKEVTVTVTDDGDPTTSVSLSADPAEVPPGGTSRISWAIRNATRCTGSGDWPADRLGEWSESERVGGSLDVTPTRTSTYTVECTGSSNTDRKSVTVTVREGAGDAPQVMLTAGASQLRPGQTTSLTWSSTNAVRCVASGAWSGPRDPSNTEPVTPSETGTYTLTCYNASGAAGGASVTIVVAGAPPEITLTASAREIRQGQPVTLTWGSTGAESCVASGPWSVEGRLSGAVTLTPAETSTYGLTCYGNGESTTATVTVTVLIAPRIELVAARPTMVPGAENSLLWTALSATHCTAGWDAASPSRPVTMPPPGERIVPVVTTIYTLSCTGPGGTSTATVQVVVEPLAPRIALEIRPDPIIAGRGGTIGWQTEFALTCAAEGGWSGPKSTRGGSEPINPLVNTDYTLTCSGDGGVTRATVTARVVPSVMITTFRALEPTIGLGEGTALIWATTGADLCEASGGWTGPRPLNSAVPEPVVPRESTTYYLTCTGPGGERAQELVTVFVVPPAPVLTRWEADRTEINAGERATLSWAATNADGCELSGGTTASRAAVWSEPVTPARTSSYLITCEGPGGTVTGAPITITVRLAAAFMFWVDGPTTIPYGGSATLRWEGQVFITCDASGTWSGRKLATGFEVVSPTETSDYTLTCEADGANTSQTITITVGPIPANLRLRATPASIFSGESSTLSWVGTGVTNCEASGGWSGPRPVSSRVPEPVTPTITTNYTLTCTGPSGRAEVTETIEVTPSPGPSISISATPGIIAAPHGGRRSESRITWAVLNADSCVASGGWSEFTGFNGSVTVSPETTTSYILTCTGRGGTQTDSATVEVERVTASVSADPSLLSIGQESRVAWNGTGARFCTIEDFDAQGRQLDPPFEIPLSGEFFVRPNQTVRFRFVCYGAVFSAEAEATILVQAVGLPTAHAGPDQLAVIGDLVILDGTASNDPNGDVLTYLWRQRSGPTVNMANTITARAGFIAPVVDVPTVLTFELTVSDGEAVDTDTMTVTVAAPTTLELFAADDPEIIEGERTRLVWETKNAQHCTATGGWEGLRPTSGFEPVSPSQSTVYTLTCEGVLGAASGSVLVTVIPRPTLTFYSVPEGSVGVGGRATLVWSSAHTTSCVAPEGWTDSRATTGTAEVSPTLRTTYTIVCTGPSGEVSGSVTLDVLPVPVVDLQISRTEVRRGELVMLSWTSSGTSASAPDCLASGNWTGVRLTSGTEDVTVERAGGYTLTCRGAGGQGSDTVTVSILSEAVLSFSAIPTEVPEGRPVTLTWTSNATSCTASGDWTGPRDPSGNVQVTPTRPQSFYTLTCDGPGGTASRTVTVTILPAPVVNLQAIPTGDGRTTELRWTTLYADSCFASGGWSGPKSPGGGSEFVSPPQTTDYTLTCDGRGGRRSARVTVSVLGSSLEFSASQTVAFVGDTVTLMWVASNVTTCTASGSYDWVGPRNPRRDTQSVIPLHTTTYTLSCTGPQETVTRSVTVVVEQVGSVIVTVSPAVQEEGRPVTVAWQTSEVSGCVASGGWSGPKPSEGSEQHMPLHDTVYILTCAGPRGPVTGSARVTVVPAAPPLLTFVARHEITNLTSRVFLDWESDATECTASGAPDWSGLRPPSGSQEVHPVGTTAYTLTCTGRGGQVTKSVRVGNAYILSAASTLANPGALVAVSWATPVGGATPLDWIGLYVVGQRNSLYVAAQRTGGTETGTLTFPMPALPGAYEFRFLPNGGYIDVARSAVVTVQGASFTLSLSATPAGIQAGEASELVWSTTAGAVGCAAGWDAASPARPVTGREGVRPSGTTTYALTCRDGAGLTVTQSVRVTVGAASYAVTATPSRVSPGGRITVTWVTPAGQATPLDWIGLYVVGRRNSLYDAAQRTGGTEAGTLTFTAPATLGSYEFRFLPNGGYIDVARSGVVQVE